MKKKLLIIGIVLAMVAALVLPTAVFAASITTQAPTTTAIVVTGTDAAPSIVFTAPNNINLNNTNDMMMAGWNVGSSSKPGTVTLTEGTSNNATWTVTAVASSPYMNNTSVNLQNYLLIGTAATVQPWYIANGSPTVYTVPTVLNAGSSDTAVLSTAGPLTYSGQAISASFLSLLHNM